MIYTESPEKSAYARREYAESVLRFSKSAPFPETKTKNRLINLLGYPLGEDFGAVSKSMEYIGEDELCEISRLRFSVMPELPFYGLLFVPKARKKGSPLVIAAHGSLGTPELLYGMHGKNGYNRLVSRILERGACVFAPQLLIWNKGQSAAKPVYETDYDRAEIDRCLKNLGGSMIALEVFCILRASKALMGMPAFGSSELRACGMSYGAYLTMRAMASSPLIRRGYFMSCFDGGINPAFSEWYPRRGFDPIYDHEIASMCAPRKVFIEAGRLDGVFPIANARREAEMTREAYASCGAEQNFFFNEWDGAHIVAPESPGIDFITEV